MGNRGGFSWKRLTGISKMKSGFARATGVPTTRSGRQRKIGKVLGGCMLPLFVVGLALMTFMGCGAKKPVSRSENATPSEAGVVAASYRVLPGERGNDDLSTGDRRRFSRDITVPRDATDEQIRATLEVAMEEFQRLHPEATHLVVMAWWEGAETGSYGAYAKITGAPGGDWAAAPGSAPMALSTELPMGWRPSDTAVPATEFGLAVEQRMKIFREIIAAERRATSDADERISPEKDVKGNAALWSELTETYKNELAERHSLTREQLDQIGSEGVTQQWPME